MLITGGAGFIGTNLAAHLLAEDRRVLVFDNLSRPGVERNLAWLQDTFGPGVEVEVADVRNATAVQRAVARARCVFHFAAQVAVTTSLQDPVVDFSVNAGGTLNVLEACRRCPSPPPLLFTSTNKVYGDLDGVRVCREGDRYMPLLAAVRDHGVGEDHSLAFHSPYGCSKGVADQYVLDYARSYDLPAVVFRMSCIYGPHQCGNEDQGWVAHFVKQVLRRQPITFYGDGFQVRDLLYVEDLVRALLEAVRRIDQVRGRAFNLGGGPAQASSLRELVEIIGAVEGEPPELLYAPWRLGDQRYYVSDTRAFQAATGWTPQVSVPEGIERLRRWLRAERGDTSIASDSHRQARTSSPMRERGPINAAEPQPKTSEGQRLVIRTDGW